MPAAVRCGVWKPGRVSALETDCLYKNIVYLIFYFPIWWFCKGIFQQFSWFTGHENRKRQDVVSVTHYEICLLQWHPLPQLWQCLSETIAEHRQNVLCAKCAKCFMIKILTDPSECMCMLYFFQLCPTLYGL